jgi:hypothetical protein
MKQSTTTPQELYGQVTKDMGPLGNACWSGGFAFVWGDKPETVNLIHTKDHIAQIQPHRVELYITNCDWLNVMDRGSRNSPYTFKFDTRSNGRDVKLGQTYITKFYGTETMTKSGIVMHADGMVESLEPLREAEIDKALAREALKLVRARLTIPFAAERVTGRTTGVHKWISDKDILKAVVEDKTIELVDSDFTIGGWNPQIGKRDTEANPRRNIDNFINRMRNDIYEAFECFKPAA